MKNKHHKSKKIFLYLGVFAVVILIIIANLPKPSTQTVDIFAINSTSRIAEVGMSSNDNQTVQVTINPNNIKVTAAKLYLSFDPEALGTPAVTLGDFMFARFGNVKVENGLLTFAAGTPVDAGGNSNPGLIATIKFSKKPTSGTTIFLTKNSEITATGYASSVLKNSVSLTLNPGSAATVTTNNITTTTISPNPTLQATLPPSPTAKPNLLTQVSQVFTKPKSTQSPKPTSTTSSPETPTPSPSARSYAATNLSGGGTLPDTPSTKKEGLLLRFLRWISSIFANMSGDTTR